MDFTPDYSAERVMKSVTRFIEEKLGLEVNAEKSKVDKPKGIKPGHTPKR